MCSSHGLPQESYAPWMLLTDFVLPKLARVIRADARKRTGVVRIVAAHCGPTQLERIKAMRRLEVSRGSF